jgi:hypothetical protein
MGLTMAMHSSDLLICRRVSSLIRVMHCLSTSSRHHVSQAREFRLVHIPGLACDRKLTLKKGDLPNHLVDLPTSISQQGGTLQSPPLSPCGSSLCHNGGHPRPSHLLSKLSHVNFVLGHMLRESKGEEVLGNP